MKNKITYGSHLPVLIRAIFETNARWIFELGGGLSSTPFLNQLAKAKVCNVITYENNEEFYNVISEFNSLDHKVKKIDSWDDIKELNGDIIFIDHAPAKRRIIDIERFKNSSSVIIVHDFEKKEFYGYNKVITMFQFVTEYKFYPKTTGVLSNFIDVTKWF